MSSELGPQALRILGSDLEFRGIKTFFIRCEDDLFVVEGGYQLPPAVTPVTLHYGSKDIEQLECKPREENVLALTTKDLSSLSQILWAVGTYVAGKRCCLISVSNTSSTEAIPTIRIEYETVYGERFVEDVKGSAIYELSVSAYKTSRTPTPEDIRYTRFSHLQEDR